MAPRSVPALQRCRWHTAEIQHNQYGIPHRGIEHAVTLPAAPRGVYGVRNEYQAPACAQGLYYADIFHEGHIVITAQRLEDSAWHEQRLIAVGQLPKARAHIRAPGHQAQGQGRRCDGDAKCPPYRTSLDS